MSREAHTLASSILLSLEHQEVIHFINATDKDKEALMCISSDSEETWKQESNRTEITYEGQADWVNQDSGRIFRRKWSIKVFCPTTTH